MKLIKYIVNISLFFTITILTLSTCVALYFGSITIDASDYSEQLNDRKISLYQVTHFDNNQHVILPEYEHLGINIDEIHSNEDINRVTALLLNNLDDKTLIEEKLLNDNDKVIFEQLEPGSYLFVHNTNLDTKHLISSLIQIPYEDNYDLIAKPKYE